MLLFMDRNGYTPNAVTFNTLMHSFVESNKMEKVVELLHKTKERNVMLDARVYSIVMDLVAKDEKYRECLDLLPSFPVHELLT